MEFFNDVTLPVPPKFGTSKKTHIWIYIAIGVIIVIIIVVVFFIILGSAPAASLPPYIPPKTSQLPSSGRQGDNPFSSSAYLMNATPAPPGGFCPIAALSWPINSGFGYAIKRIVQYGPGNGSNYITMSLNTIINAYQLYVGSSNNDQSFWLDTYYNVYNFPGETPTNQIQLLNWKTVSPDYGSYFFIGSPYYRQSVNAAIYTGGPTPATLGITYYQANGTPYTTHPLQGYGTTIGQPFYFGPTDVPNLVYYPLTKLKGTNLSLVPIANAIQDPIMWTFQVVNDQCRPCCTNFNS